jgi:hypothetical protein
MRHAQAGASRSAQKPSPSDALAFERILTVRLQGRTAIRISCAGCLAEHQADHPPGTPYVVIQADNAMNRDIARSLLRDCSSTTELAWDFGWTGRHLPNGGRVTELTLYPAASVMRRSVA